MYVSDQYAERAFYELFGFQRWYEGEEFPGFLAVRHGNAIIGLQQASPETPAYADGLRWQFELETAAQFDEVTATCRKHHLNYEQHVEQGGERFETRMVSVRSPNGVLVWFESPNVAATPSG
jgi:hypothetical protein